MAWWRPGIRDSRFTVHQIKKWYIGVVAFENSKTNFPLVCVFFLFFLFFLEQIFKKSTNASYKVKEKNCLEINHDGKQIIIVLKWKFTVLLTKLFLIVIIITHDYFFWFRIIGGELISSYLWINKYDSLLFKQWWCCNNSNIMPL